MYRKQDVPVFPDPGEELFSSLLEDEERTPPDVFSDLSTVLLSTDLRGATGGGGQEGGANKEKEGRREGGRGGEQREETSFRNERFRIK